MQDSKLDHRIRSFKNSRKREEFSLNLRRNKLFDHIMDKRLNSKKEKIELQNEINPNLLNIPDFMKETLINADEKEKVEYLIAWILEKEQSYSLGVLSDTKKFAIYHFRKLFDDFEPDIEQEIQFNKYFIEVLLYELFDSQEQTVKCEISQIFVYLTYFSTSISESLIDVDILSRLLELTYSNHWFIVEHVIIVFGNIIGQCKCRQSIDFILQTVPLIFRIKELLDYDNFEGHDTIRVNLLWVTRILIDKMDLDKYIIVKFYKFIIKFIEFINIFTKYFSLNYHLDEEVLYNLLFILAQLSKDDIFMTDRIISTNTVKYVVDILSTNKIRFNILIAAIRIIGNLLAGKDTHTDIILSLNIISIFEQILNTYMNSSKSDDKMIIIEIIWATSNITSGTQEQIEKVILHSRLPKIILQINKFKKDNKIIKETLHVFYNSLLLGSNITIIEILKMDTMRIICEAINNSDDASLILLSFDFIIHLFKISKSLLHTNLNIKHELRDNRAVFKIEKYSDHKNESLCKKANEILNLMDMANDTDNKMLIEIEDNS